MIKKVTRREARIRRHLRIRKRVSGTPERPRLCVFKSLSHIYAQVVDDTRGHTLVAASSLEPEIRPLVAGKRKTDQAQIVGQILAKRCLERGIVRVAFDRGGFKYHGRVKALAEAARKEGLQF